MAGENSFEVLENVFIPLADDRRLAARIWKPNPAAAGEGPWPAILEYIPYRKRDATSARDDSTYPAFAAAGYVGVRVDIAGHGESDGEFDDEYSPRELADGKIVIAWIAAQDWCTGDVGMMGISWGGFNSLQIAALNPPALKAVIALSTTVDRFNDDIHYKGGCLLAANFSWSLTMMAYGARPPDPDIVGDDWRERWKNRLETQPFPLATWLAHQTRDAYWKHGSICEDYSTVKIPALVIGGWADGYRNAPPACAANLGSHSKAINGPWIHKYPHFAWPKPRLDFHGEAIRWWDRWLKGADNHAEALPAYRAFLAEKVRPGGRREHEAGRWVAEPQWPSPTMETRHLYPTISGALETQAGEEFERSLSSPLDCGIAAGEYFTVKPDGELAGDQRIDDGGSLVFDSPVLDAPVDVLGRPIVGLRLHVDKPVAQVAVRLTDVHPDGAAHRVSYGVLNLTHRTGNESPHVLQPGHAETVTIHLDECGYRFVPGHRIRLSLSTAYWPMIMPGPEKATVTFHLGRHSWMTLPVRNGHDGLNVHEPADPDPLPSYRIHTEAESERKVERDLHTGDTRYTILEDSGDVELPGHGMIIGDRREECYTINSEDPLSAVQSGTYTYRMRRSDWTTTVEARSRLSCSATDYLLEARIVAREGDTVINDRTWQERMPRRFT